MTENPIKARFKSKADFFERSKRYWNPHKTQFWQDAGVDLVIDRRERYFIYDWSGKRLYNLHLNGGTYNLGHRNPELVKALKDATRWFDIGNHHFAALARTALAEDLAATTGGKLQYTIYGSGGGEAIDIAIKTARAATRRKKIVSILKGYHGHTGLALGTADERYSKRFLSDRPEEFIQVPFNDLDAIEKAVRLHEPAAVIMETIPATYGFPMPAEGYLPEVKRICERHGSLYIADEVQTGLMRTGVMWAIHKYGVEPDILVTAKGISGGLYTLGCVLVAPHASSWLHEDGFAHISTGGGAELGCCVAIKVLEITQRPRTVRNVQKVASFFARELPKVQALHPDFFTGIRQNGLIMGLEFDHPEGAKYVMRRLYENGVWAIFSQLDPRVLQWKPGLLKTPAECREIVEILERSVGQAKRDLPARAA